MRFILRQITRRAGGGDIVRSRILASAEPVIGRGSDCDIQLPDLAVNLRHAVLRDGGAGRVAVQTLGGAEFEYNGAFFGWAELAVIEMPRLGFGDHVITLEPGEEAGEVLVVVAARESIAAARQEKDGGFSLKSALFSQRRAAWIGLLAILLFCLALPMGQFFTREARIGDRSATRQWSSGPLSPGHHFLEGNCEACHQEAFVAVRDQACLSCHRADLDKNAGLRLASDMRSQGSPFPPQPARDHAPADRLWRAAPPAANLGRRVTDWFAHNFDHPNNRCASCHTEHVGSGAAPAGGAPPHVTEEELVRNDCAGCHAGMSRRLPDSKIPDVPDWKRHPDFRPLVTVAFTDGKPRLERIALSRHPSENSGLKFSHQEHLAANGAVARMAGETPGYGAPLACSNCHHADANGQGFLPIQMTRDCAQCHTLAFAGSGRDLKLLPHGHPDQVVAALRAYYQSQSAPALFNRRPGEAAPSAAISVPERVAAGVRQAFQAGGTCFECHTVLPPAQPASLAFGIAPVHLTDRYLPDGAFNHNIKEHREDAHGAPACESCHKARDSGQAADLLLPGIATCDSCHGKSKSQAAAAAGTDCAECHGFHDTGRPMPVSLAEAGKE